MSRPGPPCCGSCWAPGCGRFRGGELYLWAVVDEAALRRRAGGAGVMREQLEYLLEASDRGNLTPQVLPFGSPGHAAPGGFSIVRFGSAEAPEWSMSST